MANEQHIEVAARCWAAYGLGFGDHPWLTDLEVTVEGGHGVADELSRPSEVEVDQGPPHVSIKVPSGIERLGRYLREEAPR